LKCPECHAEVRPTARFCPACGAALVTQAPAPSPTDVDSGKTRYTPGLAQDETGPTRRLAPGERFAQRYLIEAAVGEGGMGAVYRALDEQSGQTVALKLLRPELGASPEALERFRREGLLTRRLRHPNIVAFYDVAQADGITYVTMEWLDGKTLRQWMLERRAQGQAVPFETARRIVDAMLEGLAEAHRNRVVHRDLKPENVMLLGDPDTGDFQLRILDFGIARMAATDSRLTRMGTAMGTALYMAPEQKTGSETVGPEADLYSVSVIFYELLLDIVPEGQWEPPSAVRGDVPRWVDALIRQGLAPPRARIQSAEDYRRRLSGTVPDRNHEARNDADDYKALFRRRAWAGLLDVVLILILSVVVLELMGWLLWGESVADTTDDLEYQFLLSWVSLPVTLGYLVGFWMRRDGRTPGKQWQGLRVVGGDGGPLSQRQAWIRALMWVVSLNAFLLGFLWMLWDAEHLTWHDRVAGTRVIRDPGGQRPATQ
jgi:uncharacterized RDD family membrane protein YckC